MVNENYLLVAKNLADRNKNRLNTKRSPKEQEKDELFYWIMSRLEWSVHGCLPAKKSHSVIVEVSTFYKNGKVLLKHGNVSEYLSKYVLGEDFYSVMVDVAEAFNEIGKSEGYNFEATCFLPKYIPEHAILAVHLTT